MIEFNLCTAYNAPGQENISDEDDKEKITVPPIIESIENCTTEQLEDIVCGWMRHIKKLFKLYEQKVNRSESEWEGGHENTARNMEYFQV